MESAVRTLLEALGEDPGRPGLLETPKRVAQMYQELLAGRDLDPADVVKCFDEDLSQDMVAVRDIAFHSVCEHHLLPFFGTVDICYIPAPKKLIGLSKLARIVELYARRLQLQERMASQVADALTKEAGALGVAVRVSAQHMCISMRGVNKLGSRTVSTAFRGRFLEDHSLRAEVMGLLGYVLS